jgi:hypothetical protein
MGKVRLWFWGEKLALSIPGTAVLSSSVSKEKL